MDECGAMVNDTDGKTEGAAEYLIKSLMVTTHFTHTSLALNLRLSRKGRATDCLSHIMAKFCNHPASDCLSHFMD